MNITVKNVPKLRFKEFSGEWKKYNLESIASPYIKWSLTGGPFGSDLKSEDYVDMGIRIIQLQNIGDGVFYDNYKIYTSEEKANSLISCNIYPDEIIISKMGDPVARCCLIPPIASRFVMSSDGIRLSVNKSLFDTKFIHDQINAERIRNTANAVSTGSTRKRIGLSELKKLLLFCPILEEQQKIADFLSSVDNKIQALKQQQQLLLQYKKGMMQKLFSQQIRFKDENGQDYPKWEEKQLGEVLYYEQPTKYIVKNTNYNESFTIPVLTAGKSFVLGFTSEIDGIFNKKLPVIIFDDFTTDNKYVDFPFKVKSSAIKILYNDKLNSNIKFLFEIMNIIHFSKGDEHKRYWISEYQYIPISFPCLKEQQKIADCLSAIDQKIELVNKKISYTEQFKQGLLQQLFV